MRIAIVAGEPSGDVLAAGLIREIQLHYPNAYFYGIGGEHMQALGFDALYPMDAIAIMGIESVLKDIRNILSIRKTVCNHLLSRPPDCFIGVDVPDFNFTLERQLRAAGIGVIHYVSPSVWAWRGYRIKKIKRSVDHMLTLFPFEKKYYDKQGISSTYIGHPSAQKAIEIKQQTKIQGRGKTIAILPGSRSAEVQVLLPTLLDAAKLIHQRYPDTQFILPFASTSLQKKHTDYVIKSGLPIQITLKHSAEAMCRAKLTLVASGTAALEALIYGSVMVVVYKVAWLSYAIFRLLRHVEHFSLPNQLLTLPEIPELSQKEVTPENIFNAAHELLEDPQRMRRLEKEFNIITKSLTKNTDFLAAKVVCEHLVTRTL